MTHIQTTLDNWFVRHINPLKTSLRVIFGIIWGIDGALKFQPGLIEAYPSLINNVASGQPSWLSGWFSFWAATTSSNPALFVHVQGILELSLSITLILGLLRKIAYTGGIFLSLLIWAVPEGFGGPYGPSSTDIGTGFIYALSFLLLIIVNAAFGPSKFSLDWYIESRWRPWKRVAEVRST